MPSAELNTRLTLKDQLTGGLKKSETGIRGFVNRATRSLFTLRGAFISLGVIGLGRMITSTANAADAVGKLSDRLGESSEFISRFRFAGDQAGIAANNLDTALQRVNRRFGEIAEFGRGEALPALTALGEALGEDLVERVRQGEKFSDLLLDIARGFGEVDDATRKLSIAFKLFDTEGVGLLQLLKLGPENIQKLLDSTVRVFSDEDTARAAKFKDEMGKVSDAFARTKDTMVLEFLPAATESLKVLLDLKNAADEFATTIVASFLVAGDKAKQFVDDLQRNIKRLKGAQDPAGKVRPGDPGGTLFPGLRETPQQERFRLLRERQGVPRATEDAVRRSIIAERAPEFTPFPSSERRRGLAPGAISTDIGLAPSIFEGQGGEAPKQIEDTNKSLRDTRTILDGIKGGVQDVAVGFSKFNVARAAINDIAFSLQDGISDNLIAMVESTKDVKEAFTDMGKSILRDLARIIIQATIARALGALVGGGNVVGGLSGAIGPPNASAAHGAFIPPGQMRQVQVHGGKFGEAIVPLQSRFGSVTSGGGGGGTTVIYNIQAIDVEDFDNKVLGAVGRRDGEVSSIVAARSRNSAPLRTSFGIA